MNIQEYLKSANTRLDRLLAKANKLEPVYYCKHNITVTIEKHCVMIDAPKGTIIELDCWYDSVTKMHETFIVGSDDHAQLIMKLEELESKLERLEQANAKSI